MSPESVNVGTDIMSTRDNVVLHATKNGSALVASAGRDRAVVNGDIVNKTGILGAVASVKHHGTLPHARVLPLITDKNRSSGRDTKTETCLGDETIDTRHEKRTVLKNTRMSNLVPDAIDNSSTIVPTIEKGASLLNEPRHVEVGTKVSTGVPPYGDAAPQRPEMRPKKGARNPDA